MRMEWKLPGQGPLAIHLKDPKKIKKKKVSSLIFYGIILIRLQRWSQVMYMYYFLQFRLPPDQVQVYTMLCALLTRISFWGLRRTF